MKDERFAVFVRAGDEYKQYTVWMTETDARAFMKSYPILFENTPVLFEKHDL